MEGNNNMNYKKRRKNAKLSLHYVAKELGLNDIVYDMVEKGKKSLSDERMTKFLFITEPNTNEVVAYEQYMMNALNWYEDVDLNKLLKSFKVSQKIIANTLGLSQSVVSKAMCKKFATDEIKANLYDYFNDDINKNNTDSKELGKLVQAIKNKPVEYNTETISQSTEGIERSLREEIKKLQTQISRYEKLIDRLS